ncbi:MAG: hypothetical protein QM811_08340 [Pirellulales bacterium]
MARHENAVLCVPAGPRFRVEKEIKNVVVGVAKTCHYLFDHTEPEDQPHGAVPTLIRPPTTDERLALGENYDRAVSALRTSIESSTGLTTRLVDAAGWIGVDCSDEETRCGCCAVAVDDILVRREDATLCVPIDHRAADDALAKTAAAVATAYRLSPRGER